MGPEKARQLARDNTSVRAEDMTAAAASLAGSFLPSDVLRKASRASAALAASAASAAAAVCATERGVAGAGARGGEARNMRK